MRHEAWIKAYGTPATLALKSCHSSGHISFFLSFQNTYRLHGGTGRCRGLEVSVNAHLPEKIYLKGCCGGRDRTPAGKRPVAAPAVARAAVCSGESCAPAAASLAPKPGVTRGADDAETIPQVGNEGQGARRVDANMRGIVLLLALLVAPLAMASASQVTLSILHFVSACQRRRRCSGCWQGAEQGAGAATHRSTQRAAAWRQLIG